MEITIEIAQRVAEAARNILDYRLSGPVHDGDGAEMDDFWEKGRLEGFDRSRGWWSCVKEVLNKAKTDYEPREDDNSANTSVSGPCPLPMDNEKQTSRAGG